MGTRGTGKTDFVKNLIASQRSNFQKQLVVDTFDSFVWRNLKTHLHPEYEELQVAVLPSEMFVRWKKGIYRIFSSDTDQMFDDIDRLLFDAHLVLEDATKYVGSTLTETMKKFLLDSKQKNLDVTLIFHSLVSVPPGLVRIADTLTLFKTNEGDVSKSKYPWAEIPIMMARLRKDKNRFANLTIALN